MNYKEQTACRNNWMNVTAEYQRKSAGYSGNVVFTECDLCGELTWKQTTKAGAGITIEPIEHDDCAACRHVLDRDPELVRWVTNVVYKSVMDALKTKETVR